MNKGLILFGLIGLISLFSCEKEFQSVKGTVDIYLIESFEAGEGDLKIDETSIRLQGDPLIEYSQLLSYSPEEYTFKLSDLAKAAIFEAEPTVYGLPFAVVANNEVIYTGFFWPGYFSSMCFWCYIDPLSLYNGNSVQVDLGYPGLPESVSVPDNRNDERILQIFRRDGKLKK
ncbi:MAG: hypothetical protein JW801_06380 [Bacteroidales bacterium]|nr:hypothetical protein [Bacteroidales bacterium]